MWEAEELKGQLLKAESDLRDARAALGAELDRCAEAERQLQQVRQHNDSLQVWPMRGHCSLTVDSTGTVDNMPAALCNMACRIMRIWRSTQSLQ